jgi:hypothetical protein
MTSRLTTPQGDGWYTTLPATMLVWFLLRQRSMMRQDLEDSRKIRLLRIVWYLMGYLIRH